MTPLLDLDAIKRIVEAALLVADEPLGIERLHRMFTTEELGEEDPKGRLREALQSLETDCESRGYELARVASGYRFQVVQDLSPWVSRLWEQKPPRYTRALLETLSLIAYQQPVTRGDIEEVRGVSVSSNIIRTLLERGWIREVGHREVPGRPSLYATTKLFLDYFNLKSLSELPPLAEIKNLIEPVAEIDGQLHMEAAGEGVSDDANASPASQDDLQPDDRPADTRHSIATAEPPSEAADDANQSDSSGKDLDSLDEHALGTMNPSADGDDVSVDLSDAPKSADGAMRGVELRGAEEGGVNDAVGERVDSPGDLDEADVDGADMDVDGVEVEFEQASRTTHDDASDLSRPLAPVVKLPVADQ